MSAVGCLNNNKCTAVYVHIIELFMNLQNIFGAEKRFVRDMALS